ncbi:glycerophosphodiester phosphodiesterase [Ochrobactrum sp. CM-21-5]|nr:glycerophosphodiester phosphodiesterase family protein [Ochrobactrum sp. CM-21-5]MBC2886530.1 glycerophosphodiester phosphodiesterase [Ochrobactrum sp. CM-21-5]
MVFIIGHRGGRNLWPENSLSGFRKLLAMPVEGVEFDVHLTSSGEMLVIHDPTLDRTTDKSGVVAGLTPESRKAVHLRNSESETIPTLEEVLEVFKGTALELHIELKADVDGQPYEGLEAMAAGLIDRFGLAKRSILTSFNPRVLETVRQVAPHIRTLSSFDNKSADRLGLSAGLETMMRFSDVIAVEKALLNAEWDQVTAIVPLERLGVWVPNDSDDLAYWLSKPVRQLTTDRPDLALRAREK